MNMDSKTGVIFDLDGVLIDSAEAHFESWVLLGRECGTTVPRELFQRTFGQPNRDVVPILFPDFGEDRVAKMGDRKEEIYRRIIRTCPPVIEGAVDLVRGLHAAGVALAIGSSAPRVNIELIIGAMGVAQHFDAVVSGDDVTHGKPDPEVFTLCCEKLGLEPTRCVVIEDAPVGTQAAKAAGTKTIAVLIHHPAEAFDGCDLKVARLLDLTVANVAALVA